MENKKNFKPWHANLIAFVLECVIIGAYLMLWLGGTSDIIKGDFIGGFDGLIGATWFVCIALLLISIFYLVVKPMRTKITIAWAIWNFICITVWVYLLNKSML